MLIIALPILVCIIGLLLYALATTAKPQEIGRIMFAFGLLATLLFAQNAQHILRRG